MFNGGQSPASILSPICTIHYNRLNHETYPEPCFPAPQLYLLSHTLIRIYTCVAVDNKPRFPQRSKGIKGIHEPRACCLNAEK